MDLSDLNEQQYKAVIDSIDCNTVVIAGAGSGKTKTMTSRVGYLIDDLKVEPENIMVVTFTNKAAKELKSRIYNENYEHFDRYGGRGLTTDYDLFIDFYDDMYNSYLEAVKIYGENISLDRIDNNGNYEPNNCRFANNQVQAYNKRTNFFNLEEHNRIIEKGFAPATIKQRMQKHNLTLEEALDIPLHAHIHIVK